MDFTSEVVSGDFDTTQHDSLTCYQFYSKVMSANGSKYCYFPVLIVPKPLAAVFMVSDVFGAQLDRCIR